MINFLFVFNQLNLQGLKTILFVRTRVMLLQFYGQLFQIFLMKFLICSILYLGFSGN